MIDLVFGLLTVLTNEEKNYIDLLDYIPGLVGETEISFLTYKNAPANVVAQNLTNLIKFFYNIDDNSNFKLVFKYLNMSREYDYIANILEQIENGATFCQLLKFNDDKCDNILSYVKSITSTLTSDKPLNEILPENINTIVTGVIIPILKPLNNKIVTQLTITVNSLMDLFEAKEKINEPDMENFIKKTCEVFNKMVKLFDMMYPKMIKALPITGDTYNLYINNIKKVLDILSQNEEFASLFDLFYDGISVIVKMASNAANAYVNDQMTIGSLVKEIKPYTFINIYNTASNINKLESLIVKQLCQSIVFDKPSSANLLERTLTINDIFPIQLIAQNSKELAEKMKSNDLKVDIVSKSLGYTPDSLKSTLKSFTSPFTSASPSQFIKEAALSAGADETQINNF